MIKFFSRLLVAVTCSMVMLPSTSSAAFNPLGGPNCSGSAASSAVCQKQPPETVSGSDGILGKAVNIVALIAGVAAVVMLLVASILFITSNGDSNQIANARRTVATVLIGVAIIATGRIIILYVLNHL